MKGEELFFLIEGVNIRVKGEGRDYDFNFFIGFRDFGMFLCSFWER